MPELDADRVQLERRHRYHDAAGTAVYAVDRIVIAGRRSWRYVHPDADWQWVNGRGDAERVLYALPALLANPDLLVWITQSERDADTLNGLAMIATTVASGSWTNVDLSVLRGRRVRITVDNDAAGWERGRAAMAAVQRAGALIEGVYRPNDECRDVTGHFAEGHRAGDLIPVDLYGELPPRRPRSNHG